MTERMRVIPSRDVRLLEWISQQYGVPINVVADAAKVRRTQAYDITKRWYAAGKVHVSRIDLGGSGHRSSPTFDGPGALPRGPLWVHPTRETAWGFLEFDPGEWHPEASTAAHLTALSELRLALKGLETDPDEWTSERLLRRQLWRPDTRDHIHDAWFRDHRGDVWAIEVELTRKFGAGRLTSVVSAALQTADRHDLAGVIYFTRGASLKAAVESAAAKLTADHDISALEIYDLDETLSKKKVA